MAKRWEAGQGEGYPDVKRINPILLSTGGTVGETVRFGGGYVNTGKGGGSVI